MPADGFGPTRNPKVISSLQGAQPNRRGTIMARFNLEGPARPIAASIGVVVVLFGVAVGVGVWRYEAAQASDRVALEHREHQVLFHEARAAVAAEAENVRAYGRDRARVELRRLRAADRESDRALGRLRGALEPGELGQLAVVVAGHAKLDGIVAREVVPVAGTEDFLRGLRPFDVVVGAVERRLDGFINVEAAESREATAAARHGARQARLVAILGGLLAALAALAVGAYVIRLVAGLLDRIRRSAGTLAAAASQLRAAAVEGSAATSEQSAAVAQVAATVQELRATAVSIADNARAGSGAVDQTG
ncbi:MAG TPA: hypothetical protein VNT03_04525, partial [Baekduia sp.]|nr:hypothetical protein [Baekduia sp.]